MKNRTNRKSRKKWTFAPLLFLICVIFLSACNTNAASSGNTDGDGAKKETAIGQENSRNTEQEQDGPKAETEPETDAESEAEAKPDLEAEPEAEAESKAGADPEAEAETEAESMAEGEAASGESANTGGTAIAGEIATSVESAISEEPEIQPESVGTVKFTGLSAEDTMSFAGKEMTADPDYLDSLISSDVFYCEVPLSRVEVHPIKQWAEDYSAYTISEDIVGHVENTAAEEPFRIYDLLPEGIPINCVVFYLEDGTCGTFSLGYNGSGEEHFWENAIYKNRASMDVSLGQQMEEGAVNAILNEYAEIVRYNTNGEWLEDESHDQINNKIKNGVIPQFGKVFYDENNEPYSYETSTHFLEIYAYSWKDLGIARLDINNDGAEELIIGYNYDHSEQSEDGQPTPLIAAYSVKDGKIQTLFHGWSRSTYYLTEDGFIIHSGSSGASNFILIKYALSENEDGLLSLKEAESVIVDGSKNPEKPYAYYPEEREIAGYDDSGYPVYASENALQMDEETGREYYDRIFDEAIQIDLESLDLLEE